MCKVYGYCRISTAKQSIDRQVRNILASFPNADIRKEVYTGTEYQGRVELQKILNKVQRGDTIVFDSVSRMSRNADEGVQMYQELYNKGVNLVFLKEGYINTDTYKEALNNQIAMTGDDVDFILDGVNKYLNRLAEKQIRIAFEQSEKEVSDLHKRTKGGIETARRNGKQIGRAKGSTIVTKKSIVAKETIRKHNKAFGGSLDDMQTMKLAGVSRVTFYKYKKEISIELKTELA